MNASVHVLSAAASPVGDIRRPGSAPAAPLISAASVLAWLAPRLSRDAPVAPGTVRLIGIVVHDPELRDPDAAARATWIGDGSCPHQVMSGHAGELDRFDVLVGVTWHDGGPEPVVVLVNP